MKDKINAVKKNITLFGIRIKDFVKGHKIASGAISLLLVSAIVISVMVNAEETEVKKGYVDVAHTSIALADDDLSKESYQCDANGNNCKALNFSTVYYNLQYRIDDGLTTGSVCSDSASTVKPNVDKVTITAKLDPNANAVWANTDETSESELSADKKTLTVDIYDVPMCSSPQQVLPITIQNADKETIKPTSITIKAGTEASTTTSSDNSNISISTGNIPGIPTTWNETVKLKAKVQSGIIDSGTKEGKFGVILGLNKSDAEDGNLKGKHITTSENYMYLSSKLMQTNDEGTITTERGEIGLQTTSGTFGKYESRLNLFSSLLMPELSTSGTAETLTRNSGYSIDSKKSVNVKFYGTDKLTYERGTAEAIKLDKTYVSDSNGTAIECGASSLCTISNTITRDMDAGNYTVTYTYNKSGSPKVVFKRQVELVEGSTSNISAPKSAKIRKRDLTSYINSIGAERYAIYYMNGTEKEYTIDDQPIGPTNMEVGKTYHVEVKNESNEVIGMYDIVVVNDDLNATTNAISSQTISKTDIPTKVTVVKGSSYNPCQAISSSSCSSSSVNTNQSIGTSTTVSVSLDDGSIQFEQSVVIGRQFYKLQLANVSYDGDLTYIDNANMYAVGSYYVTTNSVSSFTGWSSTDKLCLSASSGETNDTSNLCIKTDNSGIGTNTVQNNVYVMEDGEYVKVAQSGVDEYYTAAMGEEIEQEVIFSYGYDASGALANGFTAKIKVPKQYIRPIAYENTVGGDDANKNFVHIDKLNETIGDTSAETVTGINYNVTYKTSTGSITPSTGDNTYDDVEEITVNVTSSVERGTTLRLKFKYVVKTNTANAGQYFTFGTAGVDDGDFTLPSSDTKLATIPTSEKTYVTPYKLRSTVKFGKLEDDDEERNVLREADELTFDASKNDTYTGAVFPSVIAPALDISSNALGYTTISKIPLKITLPAGINYVYNKNYSPNDDGTNPTGIDAVVPTVTYNSDGTTTLTYDYTGVEPNAWVKPLYFDFNIDVTTPTSTKDIVVELGDGIKTGSDHDASSDKFIKSTHELNIENTYDVAYGQYLYNKPQSQGGHYISNADVGESFVQTIKIRNNSTTKTASNVYAYAIVPNDVSSNVTQFAGSFDVTVPSNATCIESSATITAAALAKDRAIETIPDSSWKDCSTIDKTKLIGYRVNFGSIEAGGVKTADATYTVKDNGPADIYEFDSFLKYTMSDAQASGTYIPMHSISLEVISKKIRGVVFEDFIVNGIMDKNEKKLEGVTLKLYDSTNDTLVKTTTSNRNGVYTFAGLKEGKYYVVADFNTEKYGLTTKPSQDFYDKTVMSVFREDKTVVENNESTATTTDTTTNTTTDTSTTTEGTDSTNGTTTEDTGSSSGGETNTESQESEIIIVSPSGVVRTDDIEIASETRIYDYVNLGLTPRKKFQPRITKYVSKAIVTDALGVQTIKDYKNAKIAKLDVRNMAKVKIKVVYMLEIQNTMYYPGYVKKVLEVVPSGMSFNKDYAENKGWKLTEEGILENDSLASTVLNENDKKYITVAFDITSQEAGSFVNVASIEDLQIMGGVTDE